MNEQLSKRTVVREQDPEVAAIRKIRGAIDGLSTQARARVMNFVIDSENERADDERREAQAAQVPKSLAVPAIAGSFGAPPV